MTRNTALLAFAILAGLHVPLAAQAQAVAPLAVGDLFPQLKAEFLTGRKAVLPDAAQGKMALVMMGFSYDSRFEVEAWAKAFTSAYGTRTDVTFFEVPVIGGMGRLAKWFIDSGMRKGTPRELHENVITVYGGVDRWKTAMGYSPEAEDAAYLALLDVNGRVRWMHRGGCDQTAMQALRRALEGDERVGSQLRMPEFDQAQ